LRATFSDVETIEALDELTLKVTFKQPLWNGGVRFGLDYRVMPTREILALSHDMDPKGPQMGFGPYRVAHSSPESLELKLRDEYALTPHPVGPRYAKEIQFRFVTDAQAALSLMSRGELDVLPVDVEKLAAAGENDDLMKRVWRTYYYLPMSDLVCWNLRNPENLSEPHPVLGDVRVRRALSHLFPRERILMDREGGLGVIHDGPFDFRDPAHQASRKPIEFSRDRAAELLDEAGFQLQEDGMRRRDGVPLAFAVHVLQGRSYWSEPLEVFRSEARKVGAAVELKVIPSGLSALVGSRKFDAFIALRRVTPMVAPDLHDDYHSSLARIDSGNWSGLEDAEMDSLLVRLREPLDPAERIKTQRSLQARFLELLPITYLYSRPSCILVNRRWANVAVHDLGIWYRDFVLRSRFSEH
jgi:peptide/nickel transport system substrate-binding protein